MRTAYSQNISNVNTVFSYLSCSKMKSLMKYEHVPNCEIYNECQASKTEGYGVWVGHMNVKHPKQDLLDKKEKKI